MKQTITLEKYIELGGLLEKLDLEKTSINFGTHHSLPIIKIEANGMNMSETHNIYRVYFSDYSSTVFAGMYINTEVHLTLERKYLPVKLEDKAFDMLNLLEGVLRLRDLIECSEELAAEHIGEAQALGEMIHGIDQFVKSVK